MPYLVPLTYLFLVALLTSNIKEPQMTNADAREMFNKLLAGETDPERIARVELLREYFTNPQFKRDLEQVVWDQNQG